MGTFDCWYFTIPVYVYVWNFLGEDCLTSYNKRTIHIRVHTLIEASG